MKKKISSIYNIIRYPIIYFLIQGMAFIPFIIFQSIKTKNTKDITQAIVEKYLVYILLISVITTIIFLLIKARSNQIEVRKYIFKANVKIWIGCLLIGSSLNIAFILLVSTANVQKLSTKVDKLISNSESKNIILSLIVIGILIPIVEEIIFRGTIFYKLEKKFKPFTLIIIQGLIFSIFHLNFVQFFYTLALSIIIGIIYLKSKNLLLPILIHVSFNCPSFILANYSKFLKDNFYTIYYTAIIICLLSLTYLFRSLPNRNR